MERCCQLVYSNYHLNCKKQKTKNMLVRSKLAFYQFQYIITITRLLQSSRYQCFPRISLKRSLLSLVAGNHMSLCPCANIAFPNLVIKIYSYIFYFTILHKNGYNVGSKAKILPSFKFKSRQMSRLTRFGGTLAVIQFLLITSPN